MEEGKFFGSVGIIVFGVGSVMGILGCIEDCFEIWLAPKAYLVAHLLHLVANKQ